MHLVDWSIFQHKDPIQGMTRVLNTLNRRVKRHKKTIPVKLFAECVYNIVVYRTYAYNMKSSKKIIGLLDVMKDLRANLLSKTVKTSKGWVPQYYMKSLEKFSISNFSMPRNKKAFIRLMAYDQVQRCLEFVNQDDVYIPEALNVVNTTVQAMGFDNVLAGLEYINTPTSAFKTDFDSEAVIASYKASIIESAVLSPEEKGLIQKFNKEVIAVVLADAKQYPELLRSIVPQITIEHPVIYPFDCDEALAGYEPAGLGEPPSPDTILQEVKELEQLQEAKDYAAVKRKYETVFVAAQEFLATFRSYFAAYFDAMCKKKAAGDFPATDYELWQRQTSEEIEKSYLAIGQHVASVKPNLVKLVVAIAVASRVPEFEEDTKTVFVQTFERYGSDATLALWDKIVAMIRSKAKNAAETVMKLLYEMILSG